ncbi:MAG TPA: bestrophin family protein [Luteibacter sp.]|uniref:bestrophin family protein n=1 Tax=Luteibacter sp. TaxID=1886636 RepID=UPI002CEEAE26|nr:bestrophin family protein [Luteibacter sp.]HVI56175.1 bestrophin family protein [Luteibacter sp.]
MTVHSRTPTIRSILFTLNGSIVPVIWRRVLYTIVLSFIVVWADVHLFTMKVGLNAAPLTLMGLTLAIFLGFRNTVAYQRWWDARTMWGELIIASRDIARQTLAFLPEASPATRRELVQSLIAFAYAMRHHLRAKDPSADLAPLLPPPVLAAVMASPNRPGALLNHMGVAFATAAREQGASPILLASIDKELGALSHVLGGCERIQGTPLPYAYLLLLHRTVHIYCFLLPFCLVGLVGWFTPLLVGVLAYTFFGLDALGDQIEDPFDILPNDLPLDTYCLTVKNELQALLDTDRR